MSIKRRSFLKSMGFTIASAATLGAFHPLQWAKAAPGEPPRNFIFCYFNGGWDTLMSLDPRDPAVFTRDKVPTTGIELGHEHIAARYRTAPLQPPGSKINFGATMKPFVDAGHYENSCILRGVKMDTVAHSVGRRYFITGEFPVGSNAKGSSLATHIVNRQRALTTIPNLVIGVETYNQGLPGYATGIKATSAADLIETLQPAAGALSTEEQGYLDWYWKSLRKEDKATGAISYENCDPTDLNESQYGSFGNRMLDAVHDGNTDARAMVAKKFGTKFDFLNANDPEMSKLKGEYKITSMNSPEAQAALAFQALRYQVAQCVTIQLASGLDTHGETWGYEQPKRLLRGFEALTQLVTDLKQTEHPHPDAQGSKLLDHTTIVVFSEFARTPKLNSRNGRDHHINASTLLIGAGVPHNEVIGQTSDKGMAAYTVNPKTGATTKAPAGNEEGVYLNPQNIYASLLVGAGLDASHFDDNEPLPFLSNGKL